MKSLLVAISFGLILLASAAGAVTLDTLTTFNHRAQYHYFRIPGISAQAARFMPDASGKITRVAVLLGGHNAAGEARLRIFGGEAGAPAPFLERDLVRPITVHKSKVGPERIEVVLPSPVDINSHQFFVVIDNLSEGTQLITDTEKKSPSCSDNDEVFGYQYVKVGGRWFRAQYGYAVDVVLEYSSSSETGAMSDVTADAGNWDSTNANGSIAWADIDGDSYLDLLIGGRLYKNQRGESFRDISVAAGITGNPLANLFIDVNNDNRVDLLFLGSADTNRRSDAVLFIAGDDGRYRRKALPGLQITDPTSFSVADADNDGYLDLFVGQGRKLSGEALPNLLLINDHNSGFVDRSSILYHADHKPLASQGSQWVDVSGDGFPDLFVANQGENNCELWRNNGDGTFSLVYGPKDVAPAQIRSVNGLGGHWMDHNGDGRADLLLSEHTKLATIAGRTADMGAVIEANGMGEFDLTEVSFDALGLPYNEKRGGGTWADIDNDGELDVLLTSGASCRYADLYTRDASGRFEVRTAEYGLLHVAAGPGAVFVDYNNDGLLDLATTDNGHFRLLRNKAQSPNHYVAIDLPQATSTGASVQVFAGNRRYTREVASGRGILLQDPTRLHIGVGDASSIDSVVVRWPTGRTESVAGVQVNTLTKLAPGDGQNNSSNDVLSAVGVYPNPFADKVEFVYQLSAGRSVTIQIFDQQGHQVKQITADNQGPGVHRMIWTGADDHGERISQGTYLYRITAGGEQAMGKVTLIR